MNTGIAIGDVPIDRAGLDPEQVRLILERRVKVAAERIVPREPGLAVIVCLIGGERFAVPLAAVAEVLPAAAAPVRVPGAPDSLAGLIVRRGLLYNLIDPADALGVSPGTSLHMLLLRGPVPRIALRVDEVIHAGEIVGVASEGDDPFETRVAADGTRVGLIALARLVALLGHSRRTELT